MDIVPDSRLLLSLAEQIKLPVLQIARQAELAQTDAAAATWAQIQYTADMALQLIDSYVLSVELQQLPALELEPVSVSATLQDAAHLLTPLAKAYDCELEVRLDGKYEPVMAHRAGLQAALVCLGRAFVESLPSETTKHRVLLAEHRDNQRRLVAGVFSGHHVSADMYRRARALYGRARQTGLGTLSGSGAGVFIADALLASMSSRLRVAHHDSINGLGASLAPSRQLSLLG